MIKILYILGTGRSGSTLLGNMLGEVDGVTHVGELRSLWGQGLPGSRSCGCGKPIESCDFWTSVLRDAALPFQPHEIYRWQLQVVRRRHALRLLRTPRTSRWPEPLESYLDVMGRLFGSIAEVSGASIIVDSSKREQDGALLRHVPEVDPYYLHLVRDPRAVAHSWQRRKLTPDASGRSRQMQSIGIPGSTRSWMISALFGEVLERREPERYLRIRYEDLLSDPHGILAAITRFVGCSPGPALSSGKVIKLGSNHTAGGNPDRFRRGDVQLVLDDEWRWKQPLSHRILATLLALPMLRRHGYPIWPRV